MLENKSLSSNERSSIDLSTKINGWGADLDATVRPGVPRDKAPYIGAETLYAPIEPQVPRVKINQSTEHGRRPPIVGTVCPPQFLSGAVRNYAYTLSEGRLSHWMLLILADRINVVEDLLIDLSHGHVPNVFKEMGLSTELKYNKKNFLTKVGLVSAGVIGLIALSRARKSDRPA